MIAVIIEIILLLCLQPVLLNESARISTVGDKTEIRLPVFIVFYEHLESRRFLCIVDIVGESYHEEDQN